MTLSYLSTMLDCISSLGFAHYKGHTPKGVFRVWVPQGWSTALDLYITLGLTTGVAQSAGSSVKATLQAIPTMWAPGTAPKVLHRLLLSEGTNFICCIRRE